MPPSPKGVNDRARDPERECGDAAGDYVVLNFPHSVGNVNFNNQVVLNGISEDKGL